VKVLRSLLLQRSINSCINKNKAAFGEGGFKAAAMGVSCLIKSH